MLEDDQLQDQIEMAIQIILNTLKQGGKILWCGNGGSAADAQHLSAELSGRFYLDRAALNSEALHVNGSYLTAVANDYGYEQIFARALEAKGKTDDVLVAISTSGKSKNIIHAIEKALELNMKVLFLSGNYEIPIASKCNVSIKAPSKDTPRVQECHMLIGHIICAEVEARFFK